MADTNSAAYEAHFTRSPAQLFGGAGWKRLTAFRVDGTGVLLGGAPARYHTQTALVPWQDITALVTWRQQMTGSAMNYIGVRRRPGAPLLPGPNSALTPEKTAGLAPQVDHELFLASRAVNLWRLDPQALRTAVQAFAPNMPILDAG
ncbi:hypothetical protein GCM10009837_25210 [Streptomyces durmitorensis]|uniref:Uncharacterized protein n=1 Tax=Streptomyces durmitorensis TaxID=319947 RepID=A0ABY4PNA9_9ACTN|nr:hypothetical protein [Streptomyces durmitorensis]UQT54875.1 hypothetical protein M4V62_07070 [Streptomyces durmitorensis]